jgi:thiol:disulfide interchange protein
VQDHRFAIALVALVLATGCVGSAPNSPAASHPWSPPKSPSPPVALTAAPKPTAAGSVGHLYDPAADPRADIAAALAGAKTGGKRVFLDIGADWCPDCHSLAAYMEGPAGRALVEPAFHVVRIDVGMFDRNLDVVRKYVDLVGIPTVVVLEADGSIVGASTGTSSLANARVMTERQVLDEIAAWVK